MNSYQKLKKFSTEANELLQNRVTTDNPEFKSWHSNVSRFLLNKFGRTSAEYTIFDDTLFDCFSLNEEQKRISCSNGLKTALGIFDDLLEDLQYENKSIPDKNNKITNNKVFIVHGHNSDLKYRTAHILQKLGLEPIILQEETNSSKTIIEKIEKYGKQVQAAIILFTPDDIGKSASGEDIMARGRQNVVFEAGYFMGLLGRNKTILIQSDASIELPGDLNGIVYSDDVTESTLAKELKAMGFDIK